MTAGLRSLSAAGARVVPASTARIFVVLVAMVAVFSVISPDNVFFSTDNARNVAISASELLVLACGATFVIVAGQIDLSISSQLLVSAIVSAHVMEAVGSSLGEGPVVVIGIVVLVAAGALFGLVNGLLTTRLRMPSFIVTLGTLGIGLGIAQLMTAAGGSSSKPAPAAITEFGLSSVAGVPSVVLLAVAVAVVSGLVLARTRMGLHCYGTGSNSEGARRSGVQVDRVVVGVFVLMGVFSGIAGFIDLARFSSVSTGTHQADSLTAIAAVIIGGASLFGGRGTIFGTVVGTLVPVVLLQGFVIQGVNPYWQNVAIGSVLIAAVAFDQLDRAGRARSDARSVAARLRRGRAAARPTAKSSN